mmetsp:Transcript_17000/g.22853  ORF Transcript_17000/g.22853 Transcript_17000/m.22853 type:complete len:210 (-) Transcript_17000:181-810(-)
MVAHSVMSLVLAALVLLLPLVIDDDAQRCISRQMSALSKPVCIDGKQSPAWPVTLPVTTVSSTRPALRKANTFCSTVLALSLSQGQNALNFPRVVGQVRVPSSAASSPVKLARLTVAGLTCLTCADQALAKSGSPPSFTMKPKSSILPNTRPAKHLTKPSVSVSSRAPISSHTLSTLSREMQHVSLSQSSPSCELSLMASSSALYVVVT